MSGTGPVTINETPRKLHDADVVYCYDGSFEGFLSCVFESFVQHEIPFAIWTPERETATLYPIKDIATDHEKAQRVFRSLSAKLGAETELLVTRDFLSGREDKELLLLRFLHLAFALGPGTVKRMGHPDVAPLYEMQHSLDWEVDKFQGFVRFEDHDGMLGAVIHPKNYILPLLRGHFCSRLPDEDFMIFDATHGIAMLRKDRKVQYMVMEHYDKNTGQEELDWQKLWKRFFDAVTIEQRRNERCQMTHAPKRYWKDMCEMAPLGRGAANPQAKNG